MYVCWNRAKASRKRRGQSGSHTSEYIDSRRRVIYYFFRTVELGAVCTGKKICVEDPEAGGKPECMEYTVLRHPWQDVLVCKLCRQNEDMEGFDCCQSVRVSS